MDKIVTGCPRLRGEISPPGDKSISHRALLLNSIPKGRAKLENLGPGDDIRSTISCLRAIGVNIREQGDVVIVSGVGKSGFREPEDVLSAGNSGTTMRLISGLLAAQPFRSVVTGDESLRSRPMGRLIQPLRLMGAEIWGRKNDTLAPLVIKGDKLKGIEYHLPVASAQIKSAILIAALFAQGSTTVVEPAPARDHTERLLRTMGVKMIIDGPTIELIPSVIRSPVDVRIPGDISAAAFWLVAGAIHPDARIRIKGTGLNPTRTGIIEVLLKMGANLKVEGERRSGGEPVADITVESSELTGLKLGGGIIPRIIDELPLVALASAFARGTTTISDAQELRVKESDRIAITVKQLSRLGVDIEELPDGMVIRGGRMLRGAECSSSGDHRLAMTLGTAALMARGETVVHDAEAVNVSYPGFWDDLKKVSAG